MRSVVATVVLAGTPALSKAYEVTTHAYFDVFGNIINDRQANSPELHEVHVESRLFGAARVIRLPVARERDEMPPNADHRLP